MQTNEEIFNEWSSAFCKAIELMGDVEDVGSSLRLQSLLESQNEWTQVGAYDGRNFFNDCVGSANSLAKLKCPKDNEWRAKFFYLKYIEWSKPSVIS